MHKKATTNKVKSDRERETTQPGVRAATPKRGSKVRVAAVESGSDVKRVCRGPCKSPGPAALARLTSQLLIEMMCFDVSSTVTLHLVALHSNTLARHCHASKCVCIAVTGAHFSGNIKAIISETSAWLL